MGITESLITPEHFAEVLCEDMQFPAPQFAPQIAKSIREQIQDYHLPVLGSNPIPSEEQEQPAGEDTRPSQELRILIKVCLEDKSSHNVFSCKVFGVNTGEQQE